MKHMKPLLTGTVVACLALAGCSGTPANGGSSEGPVTLTFQALYDQPAAIAACQQIVDSWNAANPNIQVQIIQAGWDSINDKLVTQFNGGTAPDIIHNDAASMVSFAEDGYLADLTDVMSSALKTDIGDGLLQTVTVGGKIISYPTEVQSYMVFANTKILQAAGVAIPTGSSMTWDQLQQIAKATTSGDVFGLGWGLKSPTASFMTLAPGFGGTFFNGTGANATISIGTGELAVPNIVNQMAYQDKTILPVTLTQSGSEAMAAFYAGQIAMTIQGSYQAANIPTNAPDGFEWTVLPPLAGSVGPQQVADPQTLSVNADSPHIAEAAQFIEYFMQADNLETVNEADALIPATSSARTALQAKLGTANHWDVIMASGDDFVAAPFLFADKYAQWKDTVATPAFQKFLAQQTDSAGLTKELTDGWNSLQ